MTLTARVTAEWVQILAEPRADARVLGTAWKGAEYVVIDNVSTGTLDYYQIEPNKPDAGWRTAYLAGTGIQLVASTPPALTQPQAPQPGVRSDPARTGALSDPAGPGTPSDPARPGGVPSDPARPGGPASPGAAPGAARRPFDPEPTIPEERPERITPPEEDTYDPDKGMFGIFASIVTVRSDPYVWFSDAPAFGPSLRDPFELEDDWLIGVGLVGQTNPHVDVGSVGAGTTVALELALPPPGRRRARFGMAQIAVGPSLSFRPASSVKLCAGLTAGAGGILGRITGQRLGDFYAPVDTDVYAVIGTVDALGGIELGDGEGAKLRIEAGHRWAGRLSYWYLSQDGNYRFDRRAVRSGADEPIDLGGFVVRISLGG
jgi:hypothetical protein